MSSSRTRRLSKHAPAAAAFRNDPKDHGVENNSGVSSVSGSDGGGMSGIDSFLYRLNNDVDLNNSSNNKLSRIKKMKQQHQLPSTSKTSNIHEDSSNSSDHAQHATTSTTTSCSSALASCSTSLPLSSYPTNNKKRILFSLLSIPILYLIYDTMISPPQRRILHHYFHLITPTSTSSTTTAMMHQFLAWVQHHPTFGAIAFIFAYGLCVILLLPGTPLTLGGGYVYKVSYGWIGGLTMATLTTIAGSLFGSCTCFLLGRYILRSRIRIWGRKKYPFFDAMDGAISENGFKIMCMLYLTPILPLGPVSYMVGTTSMSIGKFAGAKVAAVPIVMMYCFIGASTDTFFGNGDVGDENSISGSSSSSNSLMVGNNLVKEAGGGSRESDGISSGGGDGMGLSKPLFENGAMGIGAGSVSAPAVVGGGVVDESTHRKMVLFGLILSFISMSLVSHFVKKELYKIFDQQKRDGDDDGRGGAISSSTATVDSSTGMEDHIEMGSGADRKNLLRRPRGGGVIGLQEGSGRDRFEDTV